MEEEAIGAGQGGHQLAGHVERQSLLSLRKRILKETSMKNFFFRKNNTECHFRLESWALYPIKTNPALLLLLTKQFS